MPLQPITESTPVTEPHSADSTTSSTGKTVPAHLSSTSDNIFDAFITMHAEDPHLKYNTGALIILAAEKTFCCSIFHNIHIKQTTD